MRLVKYLESLSSSSSERADERRKREETDFDASLARPPPRPTPHTTNPDLGKLEGLVEAELGPKVSFWGNRKC